MNSVARIRTLAFLLCLVATLLAPSRANAFSLLYAENWIHLVQTTAGGGMSELDPEDLTYITGTSWQAGVAKDLILNGWNNYSVVQSEDALPGTATVGEYRVEHVLNGQGHVYLAGARLSFLYETTDPILDDLHYLQIVWTNYPATGNSSPYIDHQEVEFFYYSASQESSNHDSEGYQYFDRPLRSYDGTNAIQWHAATFLVTSLEEQVTIYDGVYWGWESIGQGGSGGGNAPVPEPAVLGGFVCGIILYRKCKKR